MKQQTTNNAGKAKIIILVLALVLAAVIGVFLFYAQTNTYEVPPVPVEVTEEQADITTDENGDAIPGTVEETVTSSAPVAIDLAAATSIRAIGNPDAPIKIVEYASLTCSHCAHFHNDVLPALKSKYIDTGKVYFEFREFPLNDPALKATLTARCLPADKYEGFVGILFKTQDQWAGGLDYMKALRQNAKLAGMSDATFDACQEMPMLKLKIAESMQEAQEKWTVSATPTFIINDGAEKLSGARPLEEFERIFRKLTNDAVGEAPAVE